MLTVIHSPYRMMPINYLVTEVNKKLAVLDTLSQIIYEPKCFVLVPYYLNYVLP